mgnify:CR=1 FL=1
MKRTTTKLLKELRKEVEKPRNELFDLLRDLHDSEEITTKQYIDGTTAVYAMNDVFEILKEKPDAGDQS